MGILHIWFYFCLSPAVHVNIDPYSYGDNQTSYFTVFFFSDALLFPVVVVVVVVLSISIIAFFFVSTLR